VTTFDAIIVGAGPGGSAAAYILAGAGLRVALLDKAAFPRDKLCGGLLSGRSEKVYKSIFGGNWNEAHEFEASGARFFHKHKFLNEISNYRKIYFTRRTDFDHHLVRLAVSKGATLIERTGATQIEPDKSAVRLSNGTEIRANFIIGADGVFSTVARSLGLSLQRKGLAAGLETEIPRRGKMADLALPEIHFGATRWGYGWIFPKGDTLTVGVGGLMQKNPDLKSSFQKFLKKISPETAGLQWKGHVIPFRSFMKKPGKGNVLLIGDAAGLVDPVTGEGIAFAMQSGSYAAQAIIHAAEIGYPKGAMDHYQQKYNKTARFLNRAQWMGYLVFPQESEKLLAKVITRSASVLRRFMDLLADEMEYADFCRFLMIKMGSNLCGRS
jgi:menaquinone-9 beta-reductase